MWVIFPVLVGVGLPVMGVLVVVVLDHLLGPLVLVMALIVRVDVGLAVGVGVLVLCVLLAHEVSLRWAVS